MRGVVETRGRGTYHGDGGGNFNNRQGGGGGGNGDHSGEGRDEAYEEEEEEDAETCPLCCNDMDATDLAFKPCKCGYQLCAWCWHQIMEVGFGETVGKCPACRQDYDQDLLEFDAEQVASLTDASSAQQRRERRRRRRRRQLFFIFVVAFIFATSSSSSSSR